MTKQQRQPIWLPSALCLTVAVAGVASGCEQQRISAVRQTNPAHAHLADVCADGPTLDGMDISTHQGRIDWDQVAADGIEFSFIRISDGMAPIDLDFPFNWVEAGRVGVLRGMYQFYRSNEDPIDQADLMIQYLQDHGTGELPPVVDVETTDGASSTEIASRLQLWLDRVETQTGIVPIIYTSPGWWNGNIGSTAFGSYPLWVAHWGPVCPDTPNGWSDWVFHQTTNEGAVAGISGFVDLNLFNGDAAAINSFAITSVGCGDGACTVGESAASCAVDCLCQPVSSAGRIIDETDACFTRFGELQYWEVESSVGNAGSLLWTYAVSGPATNNTGSWRIEVETAGRYRVEAYVLNPTGWASGAAGQSQQAGYLVDHASGTETVVISQQLADGWTELGEYDFATGGGQAVRLEDATGENYSARIQLLFDAIRITPLDIPSPDGGPTGGDADAPIGGDDDTPSNGDNDAPIGGDGAPSVTGDEDQPTTTGDHDTTSSGGDTDLSRRDPPQGCSATGQPLSAASALVLACLMPWVVRRRRRR